MLIIREPQMRAMGLALFERWMTDHLRTHFPDQCSGLNDPQLLEFVRLGTQKARSYGFSDEAHCCRYIDLMTILGRDFDSDTELPWARDILTDPAISTPGVRIEMLHEAACEYLERLEGPADETEAEDLP
ncbi:MAG: hypothetical protein AAB225_25235 [Acidobacteriota bacterium]